MGAQLSHPQLFQDQPENQMYLLDLWRGQCWAPLLRTEMPDTAADIAAKDAPLRSVRRAIM